MQLDSGQDIWVGACFQSEGGTLGQDIWVGACASLKEEPWVRGGLWDP